MNFFTFFFFNKIEDYKIMDKLKKKKKKKEVVFSNPSSRKYIKL